MEPIRLELPTGLDVGPVNVYLFRQPEPVLIDAGLKSPASWEALQFGLAEHNLTVMDISRVIITHPHIDHFGQAGTIAAHSDADVWICELGADWLRDTAVMWQQRMAYFRDAFLRRVGLDDDTAALIVLGMTAVAAQLDPIPPERLHTFPANGLLQLGGLPWQVIHTPGHASAQTCFYQPDTKQLLSADHLLQTTPTPVVERPLCDEERIPALPQFMQSLDRVAALDIEAVFPGHGRPFGPRFNLDHHTVIHKQRQRIQQRKAECLTHIQQGAHTPAALVDKMYAHHPPQFRFAGLWMLIGYLDLLLADGAIHQETISGVWHYFISES
ncbi:MAG: MBL fold metallo-hydrolase [Chloroflexi bacterium]|nr:MBL fold metallo-hydrolase [Chloroflexota bacterium]